MSNQHYHTPLQIIPVFLWRHIQTNYISPVCTLKMLITCKSFNNIFGIQHLRDKITQTKLKRITTCFFPRVYIEADAIDNIRLWANVLSSIVVYDSIKEMFNSIEKDSDPGIEKDYIILMAGGIYQGGDLYAGVHIGYYLGHNLLISDAAKKYNYKIIGNDNASNPTIIKLGLENNQPTINFLYFAIPTSITITNIMFDNTECNFSKFANLALHRNCSKLSCNIDNCVFNNSRLLYTSVDECNISNSKFKNSCINFYNEAEVIPMCSPTIIINCIITGCVIKTKSNNFFTISGKFDNDLTSFSSFCIANNTIVNIGDGNSKSGTLINLNTRPLSSIKLTGNNFFNISQLTQNNYDTKNIILDDTNIFTTCGSDIISRVVHIM